MIAEKPACRISDDNIGICAGLCPSRTAEDFAIAPETRAAAGDGDALARDLAARRVAQDEVGRAFGVPRRRGGIDEMGERVVRRRTEPQEEPRREAGRLAGIGLRLAFIGQDGIEDMAAEAGFGAMAARAVLIAEERMEPAVAHPALAEIVEQLHVAAALGQTLALIARVLSAVTPAKAGVQGRRTGVLLSRE